MTFYPSIEDIKIDKYLKAKDYAETYDEAPSAPYPTLLKYMNQNELSCDPSVDTASQNSHHSSCTSSPRLTPDKKIQIIAPLSERSFGYERSAISGGLKELDIYKDEPKHGLGIKIKNLEEGIFVVGLRPESPAYYAGIKFSDQIIEINGINVTGLPVSKIEKILKKTPSPTTLILRDRPFVRVITVHKASDGQMGFAFKNGKTVKIIPGTSAARNGLLTHQNIIEVNGESLVGLKDLEIKDVLRHSGDTLNLTIMPSIIFDRFFKK